MYYVSMSVDEGSLYQYHGVFACIQEYVVRISIRGPTIFPISLIRQIQAYELKVDRYRFHPCLYQPSLGQLISITRNALLLRNP
jgi:hypothetical protein